MIVFGCISPHAPILLPDVGSPQDRGKVKLTIGALKSLAPKLAATKPEMVIVSSPHPDWGIDVPLHFLAPSLKSKLKTYLTTLDSPKEHFRWGEKIASAIPPKYRIAWIASGDMSHRLKKDGPYGFHPSGPGFDQKFIELLKKKDIERILNLPEDFVEEAGECGLRSFCMLLGALDGLGVNWSPEVLSYEGPFGVGYLVANIRINPNKNNPNE